MSIPFNIKDPYWNKKHPGMSERIIGRLIIVRHGESESNIELTTTGQTTEHMIDHSLTDIGKQQAQDVADFLETKGLEYIDMIEISPLYRAIQTAIPLLLKRTNDMNIVKVNYELREKYTKSPYWCNMPYNLLNIHPYYENKNFHKCQIINKQWLRSPDTDFEGRIKGIIEEWKSIISVKDRKQILIFTHSQVISQLLSSDKSFHLANGSITIIDIDEKHHMHVHVANYTKHLRTPTGMHTCIF